MEFGSKPTYTWKFADGTELETPYGDDKLMYEMITSHYGIENIKYNVSGRRIEIIGTNKTVATLVNIDFRPRTKKIRYPTYTWVFDDGSELKMPMGNDTAFYTMIELHTGVEDFEYNAMERVVKNAKTGKVLAKIGKVEPGYKN